MQSISISPRFFEVEKRNYADWRFAFVRELIQNSVDAGATDIHFEVSPIAENECKVVCRDNGCGMSREVLQNVFLCMGETTKTGGDSVGGFGKARTLTCFSSNYYKITSGDYICEGHGAQFSINDHPFISGVIFEAAISTACDEIIGKIKKISSLSRLNCVIWVNGEKLTDSYRLGSFCRTLESGAIYANKSNDKIKNLLIVRVKGLVTYLQCTSANAGVTLEIDPDKSRECLTANRDGLKYEYKRELDSFIEEVCADTRSALKDRSKRFVALMNPGRGFFTNGKPKPIQLGGGAPSLAAKTPILSLTPTSDEEINVDFEEKEYDRYSCPVLESMIIYADTNNDAVKKVINFYDPTSKGGIGADRHKFLRQWAAICRIVVREAADLWKDDIAWAVGFCFDDDALAMFLEKDNINYLMINPVDANGKMKYSINSKADYTKLALSACHEITHKKYTYHNEDFVCNYDAVLDRVMPKLKEIFHAAADAKN